MKTYPIDLTVQIQTTLNIQANNQEEAQARARQLGHDAITVDTTKLPSPVIDIDIID